MASHYLRAYSYEGIRKYKEYQQCNNYGSIILTDAFEKNFDTIMEQYAKSKHDIDVGEDKYLLLVILVSASRTLELQGAYQKEDLYLISSMSMLNTKCT